jgi:hypothetical protein
MESHLADELGECLSARNMDRNDTNRTTAQQRKPFRIGNILAKSTTMSTVDA